jgi:hypothetical protein
MARLGRRQPNRPIVIRGSTLVDSTPTRAFASADSVTLSVGGLASAGTSALTYAAIIKRTSSADQLIIGFKDSGGSLQSGLVINAVGDSNQVGLQGGGGGQLVAISFPTTDDWVLVAVTKATGTSTPRGHKYLYSGATWTHTDSGGTVANQASIAGGTVRIGASGAGSYNTAMTGDVAVVGVWVGTALSDLNIETLELDLQSWANLNPTGLWRLDEASTATAIDDLTAGGSNQSALSGTSVVLDTPPGFDWTLSGGGGTNAPAETGTGTGTAPDPLAAVAANAEAATGTGTALDPQAAAGVNAGLASGTGNAPDPIPAAGANADTATGTGTAPDPTVSTANATSAPAEAATGTGVAGDATTAGGVNAGNASGTGTAQDPLGAVGAQAEAASGTGVAQDPLPAIAANAGAATGTGAAFDATVSTASQTNAPAEAAAGTGTAPDPSVAIAVNAGVATATGQALDATGVAGREAPAGLASGTGTALDVATQIIAAAEAALGVGTALDATVVFQTPVFWASGTVILGNADSGTVTVAAASGTVTTQLADSGEARTE